MHLNICLKKWSIGLLILLCTANPLHAQDYRFTVGVLYNSSWGNDMYARKIGDWKADNGSSNLGIDLGVKTYPWLSTKQFVYLGGRYLVQHSIRSVTPEPIASFNQTGKEELEYGWGTWSLVARYGHRVDWTYYLSTAFTAGFSVGVQDGYMYRISGSGTTSSVSVTHNAENSRRFLRSATIMPAVELGMEIFPLGQDQRLSISFMYIQNLISNTPAQATVMYGNSAVAVSREYGFNSRVRYANFAAGLHLYFGRLKGGVRVNKSNRNDCKTI
ncbi:hypothetical protein [Edaphocola flava]|uniref:hypothetical protein n=1 Tax=Edaphocola flava TaxID=2499629 RepID=UPI00100A7158|nr:hypothetical protein [Edaphocola flava]